MEICEIILYTYSIPKTADHFLHYPTSYEICLSGRINLEQTRKGIPELRGPALVRLSDLDKQMA